MFVPCVLLRFDCFALLMTWCLGACALLVTSRFWRQVGSVFTTSDADLGADLDPDHRLLLRYADMVGAR